MKSTKKQKIFISHSHLDKSYALEVIKLLKAMDITDEKIFCSSVDGYGVPLGENFLSEIKNWLLEEEVIVLFLLSDNYYDSPISLCEMGASWIVSKKVFPILIPPFKFENIRGVFPKNIAFIINEKINWTKLKDQLETKDIAGKTPTVIWETNRDEIINNINNLIKHNSEKSFNKEVIETILDLSEVIKKDSITLVFEKYKYNIIDENELFKGISEKFSDYNLKYQKLKNKIPIKHLENIAKTEIKIQGARKKVVDNLDLNHDINKVPSNLKQETIELFAEFSFDFEFLIRDLVNEIEKD